MGVNLVRWRPFDRLGELPLLAWLSLHVLLYLGVCTVGGILWGLGSGATPVGHLIMLSVVVVWLTPLVIMLSLPAACCLIVLRMLSDVRWYWFRLAAVLLFAVPLPLYVLHTSGPGMAVPAAAIQLVMALLIVQPREGPRGWADRDPTMDDHHW